MTNSHGPLFYEVQSVGQPQARFVLPTDLCRYICARPEWDTTFRVSIYAGMMNSPTAFEVDHEYIRRQDSIYDMLSYFDATLKALDFDEASRYLHLCAKAEGLTVYPWPSKLRHSTASTQT